MKQNLINLYNEISHICGVPIGNEFQNKYSIIKHALKEFTGNCQNPAIWCFGEHTKMLMSDFIYELKKVKYIIDKEKKDNNNTGFNIITKEEIKEKKIDGIIISSFKYKDDIIKIIKEEYSDIRYLDIYDILKSHDIECMMDYFRDSHPYDIYRKINKYKNIAKSSENVLQLYEAYEKIIVLFVQIKDFNSALIYVKKYLQRKKSNKYQLLYSKLNELYHVQLCGMGKIANTNVVMLCFDGLRRKDLSNDLMPNLCRCIKENMVWFDNTLSVSTSTYESLIPAYSENYNMKTKYYEKNIIEKNGCRFIKEAVKQKRRIVFYTDTIPYVDDDAIQVNSTMQTATQKMWDFLIDSIDEKNGLFYIHILYESHFSYPNPYTDSELVAEGTSILFDYLPVNGAKLKTDYDKQHKDALCYLDTVIAPLVAQMDTNMILYADHGNIIMKKQSELVDITYPMVTFSKDLIEIPMAVRSSKMKPCENKELQSLADINEIVISLLNNTLLGLKKKQYVKVQRSSIYNPDMIRIYQMLGYQRGLNAFEMFVFDNGYRYVIYSDGYSEVYDDNDIMIKDEKLKQQLFNTIKTEITVIEN